MRVKVFITIDIDIEEYPIPADENVAEEIEDGLREYLYDVEGTKIRSIKTIKCRQPSNCTSSPRRCPSRHRPGMVPCTSPQGPAS